VESERFRELVVGAIGRLPEEFRSRLENVDVVVADWPSRSDLTRAGVRQGRTLLGLYQGVPQTKRGDHYGLVMPDKITIFQGPIEARSRSEAEVASEIEQVVRHEIAHHFGISDERLRELGRG
jgi:predicted Zn-dependent protease with MMP-like domain